MNTHTQARPSVVRPPTPPRLVVLAAHAAPFRLYVVFLLLLVASVAWRRGAYFSGGVDSVVLAKAGLTMLAFLIAALTPRPRGATATLRGAPLLWLLAYLSVATVGAFLVGDPLPSFVLAARVGLLALTVLLVMLSHPWPTALSALAGSMLLLAAFGAATGVSSLAETGRLYGGIPPLNANAICFLVSVPLVITFWRCVTDGGRWFEYAALPVMLGVVWLTGARTGLAALVLALLLVLAMTPRIPAVVAVLCAACVPFVLYLTFFTGLLVEYVGRGGVSDLVTLNSRTVAWRSALDYHDTVPGRLFGGGLSLKEVPVSAMYRSEQIIDSTWVSALLQAGYLGLGLLVLLVLSTAIAALRMPPPYAAVTVALVAMLSVVSILESGMFDTTPAFILFFMLVLVTHRVRGHDGADRLGGA
ncbi:hypothetical protein [Nocardioides sediminis]|uniref:hypothetical protein n=1 Tax=Nocardioides sediminis TaxID=433648 RepID=UPI000D2F86D6|nr:hypothetical protein [Nocardioides sediminis]